MATRGKGRAASGEGADTVSGLAASTPRPAKAPDPCTPPLMAAYLQKRGDLVRFFAARLNSTAAAEDLVQDLYLKVSALDPQTEVHSPSAYLHRLASNLMLDRLRYDRRSATRDHAWQDCHKIMIGGQAVVDEPSAQDTAAARQRLVQLAAAIEELPPTTRRAFQLHKIEGLSQAETAKALGLSLSAVEKQISAALARLSAKLG